MSPMLPARRPLYSAPCAWQASSITMRLCFFAIARIGVHVGALAVQVHRQDGLGRGVMAASILAGSIVKVRGSMSTNTGVARE